MAREVAARTCPSMRVIPPDPRRAAIAEEQLLSVVRQYAPCWEPIRPGQYFLDLTGTRRVFGPSIDVAARIEREVVTRHALQGVMGVSTNKLVSQLAAELIEPVQLYDVRPGCEGLFVRPLSLAHLPLQREADEPIIRQWLRDLNVQTFG
jgi:DNA polymerase-4